MDPLVVGAFATPFFAWLSWVCWLVFVDQQLKRGVSAKEIADVPKNFWRWSRSAGAEPEAISDSAKPEITPD